MGERPPHAFATELRAQLLAAHDDLLAATAAGEEMRAALARDRILDLHALAVRNGVPIEPVAMPGTISLDEPFVASNRLR